MTSRTANASQRLPHPSKQKTAWPARPLPPATTRGKQEAPSVNIPLASPRTESPDTQRQSERKPKASPSTNPVSTPRPFDRERDKTMTVKDAAYRLKKHEDTVYLWLRTGRLRGWQLGGPRCGVLVEAASVEKALVCEMSTAPKTAWRDHCIPPPLREGDASCREVMASKPRRTGRSNSSNSPSRL